MSGSESEPVQLLGDDIKKKCSPGRSADAELILEFEGKVGACLADVCSEKVFKKTKLYNALKTWEEENINSGNLREPVLN
mgnify:CR=1 FL=1